MPSTPLFLPDPLAGFVAFLQAAVTWPFHPRMTGFSFTNDVSNFFINFFAAFSSCLSLRVAKPVDNEMASDALKNAYINQIFSKYY